jgi:hypothetical protein
MWVFCLGSASRDLSVAQHHEMLKDTIGSNYFGPVREMLTADPDRRKYVGKSRFIVCECRMIAYINVVDLGCGNGIWYAVAPPKRRSIEVNFLSRVEQMAEEFPDVRFDGLDIGEEVSVRL